MSTKIEIYNVIFKATEAFNTKPTRQQIDFISTKLDGIDCDTIKNAIEKIAESSKYFPTVQDILSSVKDIQRCKKVEKTNCERCKSSGTVVLFSKVHFGSSTFSCRCENGKRVEDNFKKLNPQIFIKSEQYAGDEWVPRHLFIDPRANFSPKEISENLNNYWDRIYKNAK